jgi:RND family efflux transporter MFP subunit
MLLPAALLILTLIGCGSKHGAPPPLVTLPTARVHAQAVEIKPRIMTEEVVGTIKSKLHATLEAKLSGRITVMPITLGQKIQKGQLIARLDAAEIAARLEQSEASLEQAERDWKRISTLFDEQSVTRADYDSAQSRYRIAKAALSEAKAMMGYVEILAPFDAVVTRKWAEVGDLAAPGKPLADIEDPSALQLEADVPEAIASHIKRDSRLEILRDPAGPAVQGFITEIGPAADPVSRTFRVKLDLPPATTLMPGQFARLLVPIGERSSLRIPATSVVQRGQLEMVFAVADQHARLHLVKTGGRVGDDIEILSGLDGVKVIVVTGADSLTDGQPVEVN